MAAIRIDFGEQFKYDTLQFPALGDRDLPAEGAVESQPSLQSGRADGVGPGQPGSFPAEVGALKDGEAVESEAMMQRAHVVHQGKAGWHAAPQPCHTSPSRLQTAAPQPCHTSPSRLQTAAPGPTVNTQSVSIGPVLDFIALPESPKAERPAGLAGAGDKSSGQPWADAVAGGGEASPGDASLPWGCVSGRIQSPLLRLHTEIVEFCRFLEPTAAEALERQESVQRVSAVITGIWKSASVEIFGSFVTGLYLPTSDIDLVVMNSNHGNVQSALKAIASGLMRKSMAKDLQVIAKAKVPIIKFVETTSNLAFDISFDVANGPQAAESVRQLMHELPPMKPLVLVLKIFLQQREFNEVYTGGIGSFALLVMVASFLLLHPSRRSAGYAGAGAGPLEVSLGVLLVDFLRLYGRSLNTERAGVSCRDGGSFFSKQAARMLQVDRPYMMSVEDPGDDTNDLCKGSWNIAKIRQAFDFAYQQLTAASDAGESLLARILRLDKVLVNRPAPAHPVALEQFEEAAEGAHQRPAKRKHRKGSTSIGKRKKRRRAERNSAFDDAEEVVMESSSLEDGAWERSQHSGSSRERRRISEEGDSGQQVRKLKARRRLRRRERSQT